MAKIFHVVNLKNEYYGLTWNYYSWLQRPKENVPLLPFFPTIKINAKTKWRLGRIHWCPRNVEKSRCKPLVSRYVCGIVSGWRGHFGCDFPPLDQQLLVLWQYVYFFFSRCFIISRKTSTLRSLRRLTWTARNSRFLSYLISRRYCAIICSLQFLVWKKKHVDVPSGHFILKFRIVNRACSSNTWSENAK